MVLIRNRDSPIFLGVAMAADVIAPLSRPVPPNVPADLTKPSESYRNRVIVVLARLFVFVVVYLALTIGSALHLLLLLLVARGRRTQARVHGRETSPRTNARPPRTTNPSFQPHHQRQAGLRP